MLFGIFRSGGASHVFRGAVGWISGAVLVGLIAMTFGNDLQFVSGEVRFLGESLPPASMIVTMLVLGALAAICIAWPASRLRHDGSPLALDARRVDPRGA